MTFEGSFEGGVRNVYRIKILFDCTLRYGSFEPFLGHTFLQMWLLGSLIFAFDKPLSISSKA